MKYDDIVKTRYSVRAYQDKVVDNEKIDQILESGRVAPTAKCSNSVFVYNLNESQIEQLKVATPCTYDAKQIFLVCYDKSLTYVREEDNACFGIQDAAIVTTHMMLKITELGLGSVWVGNFNPNKVKEIFNLEDNIVPAMILPFGYMPADSEPNERHFQRRTMEEFVK